MATPCLTESLPALEAHHDHSVAYNCSESEPAQPKTPSGSSVEVGIDDDDAATAHSSRTLDRTGSGACPREATEVNAR